jgi:hypothetical protein
MREPQNCDRDLGDCSQQVVIEIEAKAQTKDSCAAMHGDPLDFGTWQVHAGARLGEHR